MTLIARPVVPQFATKQLLVAYLRKEGETIIAQKKGLPITSENNEFGYTVKQETTPFAIKKAGEAGEADNPDEISVDIIGNMAGWCDSYMDVMIKDNWNKSINDAGASGQKLIYHLKNHVYSTDSIIGKDSALYTKMIDLSKFNIKTDIKKAQALMMSSTVVREYDSKCFMLYRDGQVKQHSIGLQYVKMYLCIDSDEAEDAQYKDNWDKYYSQVINKERVDKRGYFFAVTEAKIIEVSVVLFGANELTPVESTSQSSKATTQPETSADIQNEPEKTAETKDEPTEIRWEKMAERLSLN